MSSKSNINFSKLRSGTTALLLAALCAPGIQIGNASAQESKIYLRGFAGYTFASPINGGDETGNQFREIDVDAAASGGVAIGYEFWNNFRAEIELSRRSASIDGIAGDSPNTNPNAPPGLNNQGQRAKSNFDSTTIFMNLFYDYELSEKWDLIAGGGIGIGFHDVGPFSLSNPAGTQPPFVVGRDKSREFVWNIGAGAAYAISENLKLDMMYRYINLGTAASAPAAPIAVPGGQVFPGRDSWDADQHELSAGLRYTF